MHKYSEEEIRFLAEHIKGAPYAKITELFNDRFGLSLSQSAVVGTLKRHGLVNGRDGSFKKGSTPHNKGRLGRSYPGMEPTQFKRGHRPHNYRPLGSERLNAEGYVEVKTADPKTWTPKHRLVWEAKNGPVPGGHTVIFLDGNRMNFDLDNLALVSRRALAVVNKRGLLKHNSELSRTGLLIADVYIKRADALKREEEQ